MTKGINRSYTTELNQKAVTLLITEQGYSAPKASVSLGITDKLLYHWKAKFESKASLISDEFA